MRGSLVVESRKSSWHMRLRKARIVPVFQEEFEPPLESKRESRHSIEAVFSACKASVLLDKSNVDVDASMGGC